MRRLLIGSIVGLLMLTLPPGTARAADAPPCIDHGDGTTTCATSTLGRLRDAMLDQSVAAAAARSDAATCSAERAKDHLRHSQLTLALVTTRMERDTAERSRIDPRLAYGLGTVGALLLTAGAAVLVEGGDVGAGAALVGGGAALSLGGLWLVW